MLDYRIPPLPTQSLLICEPHIYIMSSGMHLNLYKLACLDHFHSQIKNPTLSKWLLTWHNLLQKRQTKFGYDPSQYYIDWFEKLNKWSFKLWWHEKGNHCWLLLSINLVRWKCSTTKKEEKLRTIFSIFTRYS
jgi:hypothetical protein